MNRSARLATILALPFALLAGCTGLPPSAEDFPPPSYDMLLNADGFAVYSYDKDVVGSGHSLCKGDCAKRWPPLIARAGAKAGGHYTIITREDGLRQWVYRGHPLYTWPGDYHPGDRNGERGNPEWHVVVP